MLENVCVCVCAYTLRYLFLCVLCVFVGRMDVETRLRALERRVAAEARARRRLAGQMYALQWRLSGVAPAVFRGEVQHGGEVFAAALSGDGRLLATASADKTVLVWDAASGACLRRLRGHTAAVHCLCVEGDVLISGAADRAVRSWQLTTGESLAVLNGHAGTVYAVHMRGALLASGGGDRAVRVWDAKRAVPVRVLEGHRGSVSRVHVLPAGAGGRGPAIVSSSFDRTIRWWDLYSGDCLREFSGLHAGLISSLRLIEPRPPRRSLSVDGSSNSPSSPRTITTSTSSTPSTFSTSLSPGLRWNEEEEDVDNEDDRAEGLAGLGADAPPPLRVVTAAHDSSMLLWSLESGAVLQRFEGARSDVLCLDVDESARVVVSGHRDGILRVWDIHSGECIRPIPGHTDAVQAVILRSNTIYSVSADRSVRRFRLMLGQPQELPPPQPLPQLQLKHKEQQQQVHQQQLQPTLPDSQLSRSLHSSGGEFQGNGVDEECE